MRPLVSLLVLSAALVMSGCKTYQYGTTWEGLPREQAHANLIAGDYQVSNMVASMPAGLQDEFRRATRQRNFELADPSKSAGAGGPSRRLSFWGSSPASVFVLYREQDKSNLLVFEPKGDRFEFKWGGQGSSFPANLQDLKREVAAGSFKDDFPYWW